MKHFFICSAILFFSVFIALSQTFTNVSLQAGISGRGLSPVLIGGGCAFFDYDNDGWFDIYIIGGLLPDKLYRNNGNGTFTDRTMQSGLYWPTATYYTMGVVTGDIENDGDRDIFVTTLGIGASYHSKAPNLLFRNNGNGTFTDISPQAGIVDSSWSVSASMGDYNLDGFLDIYVANYIKKVEFILDSNSDVIGYLHQGYPNFLYINNGNGTFTNVAPQLHVDDNGTALATAFTDYDNDRDMDIYVANDFGEWITPNKLFRNDYPADSFADVSASSGTDAAMYGMGIAIGDYDEDSDLDYYVTNIGENVLLNNNGNGTFSEVAALAGVANGYVDSLHSTGWGAAFLDYDHDTWLDLLVTDGFIPSADFIPTSEKDPSKLYKNNMDGTFSDVSVLEGVSDSSIKRGCAYGDFDNDGDLDLLMTAAEQDTVDPNDSQHILFRNDISKGNHWLKIKVRGTQSNRDGFGSRVEVYRSGRKWIREIDGGSSHASQNTSIAHFGLGSHSIADSILVRWPGGGKSLLANVPADQMITLIEGSAAQVTTNRFVEFCAGDSIFAGGAFRYASGTWYDTLSSPAVDTIQITRLTVHPNKVTNLQFTICGGDSIFLAGGWQKKDSVFYSTLQTSHGCDSLVSIELEVTPLMIAIADAFICSGDSIFAAGGWQKENGNYFDTFPSTPCAYVVITSLYVFPPITPDTIYKTICEGDSVFAGGRWQHVEGYYSDTFPVLFGCDSVLVTWIDVIQYFLTTQQAVICEGDSLFAGGSWRTTAGNYYDTLVSAGGCDSFHVFRLNVIPAESSSDTVFISAGDSVYLGGAWQTEQGTYTDTIDSAGCYSIVVTELILITGIEESSANAVSLSIYPNPSQSGFTVSYSIPVNDVVEIKMFSASGKAIATLLNERVTIGKHEVDFKDAALSAGIYIISFKTNSHLQVVKVVIY